jgi:HK97 family phage portal protein
MANFLKRALSIITSEKRSVSATDTPALSQLFGFGYNGTTVTPETAMKLSAVYACIKVTSEGVAKLPCHAYQTTNGKREVAAAHPADRLLYSDPNEYMTAFAFKQAITEIALRWGNGYAKIIRGKRYEPVSFKLYEGGTVTLVESNGQLFAQTPDGKIPYYDIFHLRGLGTGVTGKSPISYAAESMGISLNTQTFGNNFYENGAAIGVALKHPGKLSDTAHKHLKESLTANYAGVKNAFKPMILEEGMDITKMSLAPNEAQFLETRAFGVPEVCRWYGVPPHKVGHLDKATFSNIEQQNIEFVQDCLMPWLKRFEEEADRKLFRENEKANHYTKFSLNALMRGDSAARAIFYKEMFSIGAMSQNDIRELEDQNPIEGGDRYYVQGNNMVPIDRIDDVLSAKTAPKTTNKQENEGE